MTSSMIRKENASGLILGEIEMAQPVTRALLGVQGDLVKTMMQVLDRESSMARMLEEKYM